VVRQQDHINNTSMNSGDQIVLAREIQGDTRAIPAGTTVTLVEQDHNYDCLWLVSDGETSGWANAAALGVNGS